MKVECKKVHYKRLIIHQKKEKAQLTKEIKELNQLIDKDQTIIDYKTSRIEVLEKEKKKLDCLLFEGVTIVDKLKLAETRMGYLKTK